MTDVEAPVLTVPTVAPLLDLTIQQLRDSLATPLSLLAIGARAVSFFYDVTPFVNLIKEAVANDEIMNDALLGVNWLRSYGIDLSYIKAQVIQRVAELRAEAAAKKALPKVAA